MSKAISFNNVQKIYRIPSIKPWKSGKKIEALKNISFSCPEGKISCLLGPNGAGKTTIIKILAGLVSHDAGNIYLRDIPYNENIVKKNNIKIGTMASNDRSFYWRLTGRQNLLFFSSLYGYDVRTSRRIVSDILEELDLEPEADKPFRLYSSGFRQKFLLARALLRDPDILLLDEPTSHIDPIAKETIHKLILNNFIGKRKGSVLLCTHDLYEVEQLADYIILLNKGKVIAEGSPDSIRSIINSGTRFAIEFLFMPEINWAENLPVTIVNEEYCRIEFKTDDKRNIPATLEAAIRAGGKVIRCSEIDESITDIFTRLAEGDF